MSNLNTLIRMTIALTLVALITMIGDWMALHDIANDYVSPEVLANFGTELRPELPAWTNTYLEWRWVETLFVVRFMVMGIIAYLLLRMYKTLNMNAE